MAKHLLSKETYARLEAEVAHLEHTVLPEVAEKIGRAREMGDLSENGDYHAAKDEQGHMEGRIRHLEHLLDPENHEIVEANADGSIGPGSVVTILYEGDDEDMAERYLIGHPEEQTESMQVMSPNSPLGTALLGKAEGDIVEYSAPTGTLRVRIIEVEAGA